MDRSRHRHMQPVFGGNMPYIPRPRHSARSSINPRCRFLNTTLTTPSSFTPIRFDSRFMYRPSRPKQTPTPSTRPVAPKKLPVTTASTTAGIANIKKTESQSKEIKRENEQTENDKKDSKIENKPADQCKDTPKDPPAKEEKKDESKLDNIQSSKNKEDNEDDESEEEDIGFCKYCKMSFDSQEAYYKHTRGLLHTQNLMAAQNEDGQKDKGQNERVQGQGQKEGQKGQKQGQGDDQGQDSYHISDSSKSVNAKPDKKQIPTPMRDYLPSELGKSEFPSEFHCKMCDAKCNSRQMYLQHLEGNRHKNMARSSLHDNKNPAQSDKEEKTKQPPDNSKVVFDSDRPSLINKQIKDSGLILIGMQYVIEFRSCDTNTLVRYICNLCEAKCNTNTLVPHVGGLKHRLKYFKEHYPDYFTQLQSPTSILKKSEVSAAAEEFAKDILKKEGNGKVKVKLEINLSSEEALSAWNDGATDDKHKRRYGGESPVKRAYFPELDKTKSIMSESDFGKSWMSKSDFGKSQISESDFRKSWISTDYDTWSGGMGKGKWEGVYPDESDRTYIDEDRKNVYRDYHRQDDKGAYSDYHRLDDISARHEYDRSGMGKMNERPWIDESYHYGYNRPNMDIDRTDMDIDRPSMDIDRSSMESNRLGMDSIRQNMDSVRPGLDMNRQHVGGGYGMDNRDNMFYQDDAGQYGDNRFDTHTTDQYSNRRSEMDINDQPHDGRPIVDKCEQPVQRSIVHDYGHGIKRAKDSSQQEESDNDSDESNQALFQQFLMWKQQQKKGKKIKQTDEEHQQQTQHGQQQQQQQQKQQQGQQHQQRQQQQTQQQQQQTLQQHQTQQKQQQGQQTQQQQKQTENVKMEEPSNSLGDTLMAMASTMIRNEEEAAMALQVSSALTQALLQYRLKNATSEIVADLAGMSETSQQLGQKSAAPESAPSKVYLSKAGAKSVSSLSTDTHKVPASIPQKTSTTSALGGQSSSGKPSVGHELGQTTGGERQIFDASEQPHANYNVTWSQTHQQLATHGRSDNSSNISFDIDQWNKIRSQKPPASLLRTPAPVPPPQSSDFLYRPVPPPDNQYY